MSIQRLSELALYDTASSSIPRLSHRCFAIACVSVSVFVPLPISDLFRIRFNIESRTHWKPSYPSISKLIHTGEGSTLTFRPLDRSISATGTLIWKKYQVFNPAAQLFIDRLRKNILTLWYCLDEMRSSLNLGEPHSFIIRYAISSISSGKLLMNCLNVF